MKGVAEGGEGRNKDFPMTEDVVTLAASVLRSVSSSVLSLPSEEDNALRWTKQ